MENEKLYPNGYIVIPKQDYDDMNAYINELNENVKIHEQSIEELKKEFEEKEIHYRKVQVEYQKLITKRDAIILDFLKQNNTFGFDENGIYKFSKNKYLDMGIDSDVLVALDLWAQEEYKKRGNTFEQLQAYEESQKKEEENQ